MVVLLSAAGSQAADSVVTNLAMETQALDLDTGTVAETIPLGLTESGFSVTFNDQQLR
jgi:hypothetical protein